MNKELKVLLKSIKVLYNIKNNKKNLGGGYLNPKHSKFI